MMSTPKVAVNAPLRTVSRLSGPASLGKKAFLPLPWIPFCCLLLLMLSKVCSAALNGIEAYPVEVEVNAGWGDKID
jgi:hypothetical protein